MEAVNIPELRARLRTLQLQLQRLEQERADLNSIESEYAILRSTSTTKRILGLGQESEGLSHYLNVLQAKLNRGGITNLIEADIDTQKRKIDRKIQDIEAHISQTTREIHMGGTL